MKNKDIPPGTEVVCVQICFWRNRRWKPGDKATARAGEIVPEYFEPVTAIELPATGNPWLDLGKWNKRRIDDYRAFIEDNAEAFKTIPLDIQGKAKDKWDKLSAGKPWPLDFKRKPGADFL
jgi:hypothetical protein